MKKKMNLPRQGPLFRILSYAIIVILFVGAVFLLFQNRTIASNKAIPLDFLSSTTPTPYPLPTSAYDLLPLIPIVTGTISEESNQFIDPDLIKENGQQRAENEYLDLYLLDSYLPVDVQWWQQESKQIYEYVSKRLDIPLNGRVIVTFAPPQSRNCPARGLAFPEQQVIVILADEDTSKEQIRGVLAHELGHIFILNKHKNLNDTALSEGMATWAAGEYWKEWKGLDFNSSVRNYINKGSYLPLFQNYDLQKAYDETVQDCVTYRDILYTEMASFIDYLIQSYGMDQLFILFDVPQPETIDNKRIVTPPRYKDVYGLEFNQLEYKWLKALIKPNQ